MREQKNVSILSLIRIYIFYFKLYLCITFTVHRNSVESNQPGVLTKRNKNINIIGY